MSESIEDLFVSFHLLYGSEIYSCFESTSPDVVFIINGQPLPANKSLLSENNDVFKAMFSGNFKESKDNEVVVEGTTCDAFKTLVIFIYFNELYLKDCNDFELIEEVYKLTDRYNCPELQHRIIEYLISLPLTFDNIESITRFAFNYQMEGLIENVSNFVNNNLDYFVNKVINGLEDTTHKKLFKVLANKYREVIPQLPQLNKRLDLLDRDIICECGHFTIPYPGYPDYIYCKICRTEKKIY